MRLRPRDTLQRERERERERESSRHIWDTTSNNLGVSAARSAFSESGFIPINDYTDDNRSLVATAQHMHQIRIKCSAFSIMSFIVMLVYALLKKYVEL